MGAVCISWGCTVVLRSGSEETNRPPLDFSNPVLNQRRVFVVDEITSETAESTIRQLLYLDTQGQEPITLYLMTPGGDLNAAFAIQRAVEMLRSKVSTVALGECNSGGAVLLAGGTGDRRAYSDSVIVLHGMKVSGRPPARYVELNQVVYTAFWREHAHLPQSWLPMPQEKTFVLSAQEALEYGVIDSILSGSEKSQK